MVINRRFTLLNPPEEVRKAEFNRARADIAQTIHFCPGDPTSPKGYDGTCLPAQNTHAFQADIFPLQRDCWFCLRRPAGAKPWTKPGRGDKSLWPSANVERMK